LPLPEDVGQSRRRIRAKQSPQERSTLHLPTYPRTI
jgi:hypothetical protein